MPRIQQFLANLINDLGEINQSIIPLVSGDLMDTPDEDNLDRVRSFLGMLKTFGTEEPIVLLGNHDVRKDRIPVRGFSPGDAGRQRARSSQMV